MYYHHSVVCFVVCALNKSCFLKTFNVPKTHVPHWVTLQTEMQLKSFNQALLSFNFTREGRYCFQRVLAITILSLRPSVCLSHGWISQKRCKLESPNLHHRLPGRLVSETVKLFYKFEKSHPEQGR